MNVHQSAIIAFLVFMLTSRSAVVRSNLPVNNISDMSGYCHQKRSEKLETEAEAPRQPIYFSKPGRQPFVVMVLTQELWCHSSFSDH